LSSSRYFDVVHAMDINERGTVFDFMFDAGLGNDPPEVWDDVLVQIEKDLMPKHQLHDLVGKKVWPMEGRRSLEQWAKNKGLTPMAMRTPVAKRERKGHLFAPIADMLAVSADFDDGAPRKLSKDMVHVLEKAQQLSLKDVSAAGAKVFLELARVGAGDTREKAGRLEESRAGMTAVREVARETAQAMLQIKHDVPSPQSAANSEDKTTTIN
jgi:hypothetical protein